MKRLFDKSPEKEKGRAMYVVCCPQNKFRVDFVLFYVLTVLEYLWENVRLFFLIMSCSCNQYSVCGLGQL